MRRECNRRDGEGLSNRKEIPRTAVSLHRKMELHGKGLARQGHEVDATGYR
jgi:hypothetical protein